MHYSNTYHSCKRLVFSHSRHVESVNVLQCHVISDGSASTVVQQGHAKVAQVLLRAGASLDKPTSAGLTPLDPAALVSAA